MIRNHLFLVGKGEDWGLVHQTLLANRFGIMINVCELLESQVMCRCCSYYTGELFVSAPIKSYQV